MPRVLLLLPTTTYRAPDFLAAAGKLGLDVTVASEEPSALGEVNPAGLLTLELSDPEGCARRAVEFSRRHPISAVVGMDEDTSVAASAIAEALDLPHNPRRAAEATRNKALLREALSASGVASPRHDVFGLKEGPLVVSRRVRFPCVLKPTFLSGSRGVIRANDEEEFVEAWERITRILGDGEVRRKGGEAAKEILVEEFVPGVEVALEGLLRKGELEVLAVFDKPDPLEGPFFEETIYVTPSRLPDEAQGAIADVTTRGCRALGLVEGPVHAELRLNDRGPWLIELAARSIGGLCSRTLRFGTGMSLEELILRHALGTELSDSRRDSRAAGVMMIPVPAAGRLEQVEGVEAARGVPDIEEVTITARPGQTLVPLPEGSRYPGFLFSRAESPARAEAALREAHAKLRFVMASPTS